MRVLLTTWGSRGDVEPLVGLAVALRGLGAEAVVCAPPDEEFATLLDRAGVPLVPVGPAVRSVTAGAKPPTAADAVRLASDLVTAGSETLAAAAEGCDVLLANGMMAAAGARGAAERRGIPYVYACYHVRGLPPRKTGPESSGQSARDAADKAHWEQGRKATAMFAEALNSHRAGAGLPPVDDYLDHVYTARPWLAADAILCPAPPERTDIDVVQTGAWVLPDERPLPQELEAFLAAGEPPVYVGFGSMATSSPEDTARVAIEAGRAQGRRLVLARGWAGLAPIDDADDCFLVGDVNQQALFPRVAAIVHHGGAGTTTTASRSGTPQVVVPQIGDQPSWAARVAELGIGVAHRSPTATLDSLTAALTTGLAPETRTRARAVADAMRTDGATVAAKLLLEAGGTAGPRTTV
ncbi:Vancomycin aglycone glucosyltransferase [Streptomyces xanthophaeus]|uniref:glycosyltransferase n=1 Tax=Streptomyces xanthophaeus TaxID=67385 RepID=UPI00233E8C23|nr:glycosyltransferase [Streptomyces xanthophaeus]WCD84783.1 Vancomycin aglycone glucosyltransferase [Streptomyces xanthophaeus]